MGLSAVHMSKHDAGHRSEIFPIAVTVVKVPNSGLELEMVFCRMSIKAKANPSFGQTEQIQKGPSSNTRWLKYRPSLVRSERFSSSLKELEMSHGCETEDILKLSLT